MHQLSKLHAFNLLEIIITLVLITILALLANYHYQPSMQRTQRQQAIKELLKLQLAEERYYLLHQQYASLTELIGQQQFVVADGNYLIYTDSANQQGYTLVAQAQNKQMGDKQNGVSCRELRLRMHAHGLEKEPASCWPDN